MISVIGDGALTGGMAYEALNNASQVKGNFIIVLNDNNMSISKNVGGVSKMLGEIRASNSYYDLKEGVTNTLYKMPMGSVIVDKIKKTKSNIKQLIVPNQMFEGMGITYLGPVDGHDIEKLIKIFKVAKRIDHAVLVHVVTQKGHGYRPAERNPSKYHGIAPFDIKTGNVLKNENGKSYSEVFSEAVCKLAKKDAKIAAITAAMPDGTGLAKFSRWYPERFFDVGIAEAHAVTFSAGLAAGGLKPVFAVYSSFLQRAYDQILHDVCIQNLPVVFAIDRAGLVGSDGETHQGIFDISYLSTIPNMTIMAPKNKWELSDMIKYAVDFSAPIAIRYPRGEAYDGLREYRAPIACGKSEWIYRSGQIALFALGAMVKTAEAVHERLKALGYESSLINARFAKPLDEDALLSAARHHDLIVTMEENVISGGMGEQVMRFYEEHNLSVRVLAIAIPDEYVEHGNVEILRREVGIDAETITERTIEAYEELHAQESGAERNDF